MPLNPLKIDPQRATTLRRRFLGDMRKRFRKLRGDINRLVITEDAFGLAAGATGATGGPDGPQTHVTSLDMVFNNKWAFSTDDAKLDAYRKWLKERVDAGILEVSAEHAATPWTDQYVKSAYKKGLVRAYTDTHAAGIATTKDFGFIEGGKAEFLKSSFAGPVGQSKLKILSTRSFAQLEGVTASMDQEMSRILADGLAAGHGPRKIAAELNKSVSGLEKKRALAIARTETAHAHSEGQLDAFEEMGVEELGIMAEWSTAHDGKVCPLCRPLEGIILTIKEARGMLPRHPNCRCAWIPAGVGEDVGGTTSTTFAGDDQGLEAPGTAPTGKKAGQVWHKDEVGSRLRDSVKAEKPKLSIKDARKASLWKGADLTKVTAKLKPGSKQYAAAVAKKKAAAGLRAEAKTQAAQAAAAKIAHSLKVKVGMAKKSYGLTDDQLFFPGDSEYPVLTSSGGKEYAASKGIEDWGHTDWVAMQKAAKQYQAPSVPVLKAQMMAMDDAIATKRAGAKVAKQKAAAKAAEKKLAVEVASKDAMDAAGKKATAWKATDAPKAQVLDNADYDLIDGWDGPHKGKTQSYGVILFDDEGRVLMREPTNHYGGTHWTFAKGGGTKPGSTAFAELAEETGHKAAIHDILPGKYKGTDTSTNYFLGKSAGYDGNLMDAETFSTKWMTMDEALEGIALGTNPKAVVRDTQVLKDAFAHMKTSNGKAFATLTKTGEAGLKEATEKAAKLAHAHKVKLGMAKKHYAKEKFGGGAVDADWTNPMKTKLGPTGINKVLSEKGWHTTTIKKEVADALEQADDVVAQKAIMDGMKKAPKGTIVPKSAGKTKAQTDGVGILIDEEAIEKQFGSAAAMELDFLDTIDEKLAYLGKELEIDDVDKYIITPKAPLPKDGVKGPVQFHAEDDYWNTVLKAAKTVSIHAKDGAYNTSTLALMDEAAVKVKKALKAGNLAPDTQAMLEHYDEAIATITKAKAAGQPLKQGDLKQFTFQPNYGKPAPGDVIPIQGAGWDSKVVFEVDNTISLGGSTGAKKVKVTDSVGSTDWVMKDYSGRELQAENEFLANSIYNSLSPDTAPASRLAYIQNRNGETSAAVFNKFVEGGREIGKLTGVAKKAAAVKAKENFVLDAWLANWDAVGLSGDNMMVVGGKVVRIDNGGALLFRAQGGLKGKKFGGEVEELKTFLDPKVNPSAAKLYKGITNEQIVAQIEELETKVTAKGGIDKFLQSTGIDKISDPVKRQEITEALTQRFNHLTKVRDDIEGLTRIPMSQRAARLAEVQVRKVTNVTKSTKETANRAMEAAAKKIPKVETNAITNFTGSGYMTVNSKHMKAIRAGKAGTAAVANIDRGLAKIPGFKGTLGRGQRNVSSEQWQKWTRGEWGQVWWTCPSSSAARPESVFTSGRSGVCYIIRSKGKRNAYVQKISSYSEEHEALFMSDSAFQVVGYAESDTAIGSHYRFLVIDELDAGETAPLKQAAPTKLNARELWQAFKNDATRAGMTNSGTKSGPSVNDLFKGK